MDLTRRDLLAGAAACLISPGLFSEDRLSAIVKRARKLGWRSLPIGDVVAKVGLEFLGVPYVGGTLETSDTNEACVVNLEALDCVTFYELSLCIARMFRSGGTSLAALKREIVHVRYRDGKLEGYLSRLHYTTDWIYDNSEKGVVEDLTGKLPGTMRMDKSFDFMSTHPKSYRQLSANPELVKKLAGVEHLISRRRPQYVPKERVVEIEPLLQSGDIIGIATSLNGLDCSHTGLVYVSEDKVRHFLNASSIAHKVVVGPSVSGYLAGNKRATGIVIARPV